MDDEKIVREEYPNCEVVQVGDDFYVKIEKSESLCVMNVAGYGKSESGAWKSAAGRIKKDGN